jgi:hypothetical protein
VRALCPPSAVRLAAALTVGTAREERAFAHPTADGHQGRNDQNLTCGGFFTSSATVKVSIGFWLR